MGYPRSLLVASRPRVLGPGNIILLLGWSCDVQFSHVLTNDLDIFRVFAHMHGGVPGGNPGGYFPT